MTDRSLAVSLRLRNQGPVLMMSFGHAATHWIAATLYIMLPLIKDTLGLSYAQAGLFLSIFHVSSFLANFASGLAVDISGRRILVQVVALLLGAFAALIFGLTGSYAVLCLMVGFMGAAVQAWHPGAITFLSERYAQRRGYVLSIHAMGANAGDALAPMAAGALLTVLSWKTTAMLSAVPSMLMAAVLAVLLLPADRRAAAKNGAMDVRRYFAGYISLVRDRAVLTLTMTSAFRTGAQVGIFAFLPLYIADVMQAGTVYMGAALMTIQIGGFIAAPVAGVWSDRIGRRPIVFGALGFSTILILALTFVDSPTVYVVCVSVLGFFLFAVRPVVQSWMMDIVPRDFAGSATSLMFGVQSMLGALAPIVGGLIADSYGLLAVFYMLAGVMLFANVLVFFIPKEAALVADRPGP